MKVLCIGEIVGKAGIFCIKNGLKKLIEEKEIDFVIANGEGASGGFGLGKNHSIYLHKLGINVLTSGEKIYYKKDMVQHISKASFILRPANYPPGNPGRGWKIFSVGDKKIGVISLLGQSGFTRVHLSNPFTYLPDLIAKLKPDTDIIIVDFHASTTAEKYSMFHYADGRVSAVIGTHFKVQTADETILPGGTGIICDTGRTGSFSSVGGFDPEIEVDKFLTGIPERSGDFWDDLEIQGVVLDINDSGKTEHIERFKIKIAPPDEGDKKNDRKSNSN